MPSHAPTRLPVLEAAKPPARSRLNAAIGHVSAWPDADRKFFVAAFTTRKSGPQIAFELGLSMPDYLAARRQILRRFMQAAQPA